MTYIVNNLIKGVFIKEAKTRFLCEIRVDNETELCYVPISCKLSNLIELKENEVLLLLNNQNARTKYTLFAVKHNETYIMVNTVIANRLIYNYYLENKPEIKLKAECFIKNYKCDFYNEGNNLVIEVKSIISMNTSITLPNMNTKRAVEQLRKIKSLIRNGYKIEYYFLVLSEKPSNICIKRKSIYGKLLYECMNNGMDIICFHASIIGNEVCLSEKQDITFA